MEPGMQNIITAVVSALTSSGFVSLVLYFLQRRDKKKEKEESMESATSKMLLGLGHDRILSITDRLVKRGSITLKEKRNLEYLWKPYNDLGGNGDCKIGYDACQKLPVASEEAAEELDVKMKLKEYGYEDRG